MKTRKRSIIALILVLCMSLSLFACNKNEGDDGNGGNGGDKPGAQTKSKPTNVYKETPVPLGDGIQDLWSAILHDGRVYYTQNVYDETTYASTMQLNSISITDPSDTKTHLSIESNYSSEENIYSNTYLNSFSVAPDGAIWASVQSSYEDYRDPNAPIYENNSFLRRYDEAGEMTLEIKASDILPDEPYVYFGNMKFYENFLYVGYDTKVFIIDATTGKLVTTLTDNNNSVYQMLQFNDGRLGVLLYDNEKGGQIIKTINPASKGWGETIPVASSVYFERVMPGDSEYLLYYYSYNQGIMGLKADGTTEEIVNFLNSDIDTDGISNVMKLDGGDFLLFSHNYESQYTSIKASRLTKVPDSEVKEAIMLSYACMYVDYNLKRKILAYNKLGGDYRIQVRDYSQYITNNDYKTGLARLNADIIGGNIPDMMSLQDLDFRTYANKGILADLYELMDASTVADRSDYVQNVLKAAEYNGKLYRFTPEYYVQSAVGKKSIFGDKDSWTIDDLEALLKTYPGSKVFGDLTRDEIIRTCLSPAIESFIDWETGQCSFDEGFVKMLEFAKSYPETIDWENRDQNYWQEHEKDYAEGKVLLQQAYVSSYRAVRDYEYSFEEETSFVGYPSPDGKGSVYYAYGQHGISATSPNKQVCFDFLAGTVNTTPDFANSGGYFYGNFSLSQKYMDAMKEYELTPLKQRPGYVNNNDGAVVYDKAYARASSIMPVPDDSATEEEDEYTKNYHLQPEEVAEIDKLLDSVTGFYEYNESIMNIVTEEAAEFFAGRRSGDETARIVQSRVQIFVSESM